MCIMRQEEGLAFTFHQEKNLVVVLIVLSSSFTISFVPNVHHDI